MTIDKINIINLALTLIGAKNLVATSDATKSAPLALALWDLSYRGMLELPHNWAFATVLAQLSATTAPIVGGYDYRFTLPVKCLRVIAQIDEDDEALEYEHRIENYVNTDEKSFPTLVTNESECFIKYLYDLGEDYEIRRWPAWFSRLVALDIAILLCEPMKQDKVKKNQLLGMLLEPTSGWLARAIQADGMYGMNVNSAGENSDSGNRDVLGASTRDSVVRRHIVERE